ncbi:acyl-CoA thioesterase [Streptomyces hainanensis]|uniref:Acyl-CoA thioesterase n=1 Tax=Streptomyces hainanensis TaxID=402648 RepID=A0A4R4T690_9ACTN|nr:thioesterase family protein [Streptomyces hainanensis]TDC72460.1 acyl-CoA thioesterase [Streptomyces hainanensis]
MRHVYQCPLRWSDMDAFGHINNVVYLRYLEEARIDFMFRLARQADSGAFTGGSVVARHEIDYLKPMVHRHEPVTIETWVARLGGASVTVAYEIRDAETVYARAATVVVPYRLEDSRPRRLTAEEREFLGRYRDDETDGVLEGSTAA